jgi:hypothetical protein
VWQTGTCVQKLNFAVQNSLIHFLHSFSFLRTYVYIVYPFSQERQRSCPPEDLAPNIMRVGRRVDVMLTWVKEDHAILHLQEHPRGQFIETSQEVAYTLIYKLKKRKRKGRGDCKSPTKRKNSFPSQANNKKTSQAPKL